MSDVLSPMRRAALDNAHELGLVLSEIDDRTLMARANRMRAEAHAEMWAALGRLIKRAFVRAPAATTVAADTAPEAPREPRLPTNANHKLAA